MKAGRQRKHCFLFVLVFRKFLVSNFFKPIMLGVHKMVNTREKSCNKCCNIFNVCMTIFFLWAIVIIRLKQKQPPEEFYKTGFLKHFTIFIEKHLCWSLFLIKLEALVNLCNRVFSKNHKPICFSNPKRVLGVRFPLNEINVL